MLYFMMQNEFADCRSDTVLNFADAVQMRTQSLRTRIQFKNIAVVDRMRITCRCGSDDETYPRRALSMTLLYCAFFYLYPPGNADINK